MLIFDCEVIAISSKKTTKRNPRNKVSILLGKNIVYFRQLNNISQDKLVAKLKSDKSYLSEVENAKRMATTEFIYRISKALNVEPDELFKNRDFKQLKSRVDSRK